MSLQQMLLVLRARWSLFAAVWLGTVTVVVLVSLLVPAQYSATATVLIEEKTSDPIAGVALPGGVLSNHIATQIDVIQSDRVALRALRALHLQESDEWRARWKAKTDGRGSFEAW